MFMSTHEMVLRQICLKSFLRLKLILMGENYIYSIAIRVLTLVCIYYSYCREGNSNCARSKAKPVVNTTRRKFTSHFNVGPFQRLQSLSRNKALHLFYVDIRWCGIVQRHNVIPFKLLVAPKCSIYCDWIAIHQLLGLDCRWGHT